MIITHNLPAMSTSRIVNANIEAHAKSTSKISSGYGINRAVDNPSGLAISETMRRQIRGLMQGINNTKDGVAFVQIADGAMDEIHAMLQRMNELSLKSLNGLCTAEDRLALNAEFDQLRTEIDRINDTTTFNTQPVFDNHEASYYQIRGNRQWKDNQLHTISSAANELNIHLPDNYDPKDYTLTIPAGTYTTQELMDEIDDALAKMDPPNPGFVFEYTSDGYCNLNFESAEGKPTNIAMVDGSLSYLIYEFETGGSPATLLGTSPFTPDEFGNPRRLQIVSGHNDELTFYAENAEGSKKISIKLDAGFYDIDHMIEHIKEKLKPIADAKDITVQSHDGLYIQITGGNNVNITGLKGNMFKYEVAPDKPYTSVFYDNVVYGSTVTSNAQVIGYPNAGQVRIFGNTANQNNVLRFKVNGDTQFREITFPAGDYTGEQLAKTIKDYINNNGLADEIDVSFNGRLQLYSKKYGTQSKLIFDTTDPVSAKTYEALFLTGSQSPTDHSGQFASIKGTGHLGEFDLEPNASLVFMVKDSTGTKECRIENIGGHYTSLQSLVDKLNPLISGDLQQKIQFESNGGQLVIQASTTDVEKIYFEKQNKTYLDLFTSKQQVADGDFTSSNVTVKEIQGSPGTYESDKESITITAGPCKLPITIDGSNNQVSLSLYNDATQQRQPITILLDNGTYNTIEALAGAIDNKLRNANDTYKKYIEVNLSGNQLSFKLTVPTNGEMGMVDGEWNFSFSQDSGSIWPSLMGTSEATVHPIPSYGRKPSVISSYPVADSIELSDALGNNKLQIQVDNTTYTLTINGKFNSKYEIQNAIQDAINKSPLNGSIKVSLNNNKLVLTAADPKTTTLKADGELFCKGIMNRPFAYTENGAFAYNPPALIIGRRDLTKEPITITADSNDTLTFDFTYPGSTNPSEINITIPEGTYNNGYELVNIVNEAVKKQLEDDVHFGKDGDFDLTFSIGGFQTNATGNIDSFALQITANPKPGKEPVNGQYIIDGVRGSASCHVFYKTTSLPTAAYIVGTKDIRDGIHFEPGKNVLTFTANSDSYKYTFEENKYYTADEFVDELNRLFEQGDDNGNPAPVRATLEDGAVKIYYKTVGANTITDIGGSARGTIFFEEEGRDSRDPLIIQAGAEQRSTIELPRIRVDSCSLGINSITISKEKYAEKAVEHIKSAIKQLSGRRSTYGAMQNRLEHTINNNENVSEQVQASESRIRDTDMSTELIRYSNLNILLKAGHKMITYSNNRIQKLLTILE